MRLYKCLYDAGNGCTVSLIFGVTVEQEARETKKMLETK